MFGKLIIALALLCLSLTSFALQSFGKIPAPSGASPPALYFELNGGYAFRNWPNTRTSPYNPLFTALDNTTAPSEANSNSHGGLSGGVDIGFLFNKNAGAEIGGFYLPKVSGKLTSSNLDNSIVGFLIYLAGKLQAKAFKIKSVQVNVFSKMGAAYVQMIPKGQFESSIVKKLHNISLVAAAGIDVKLMPALNAGLMYMFVPGNNYFQSSPTEYATPNSSLVMLVVGYQLSV